MRKPPNTGAFVLLRGGGRWGWWKTVVLGPWVVGSVARIGFRGVTSDLVRAGGLWCAWVVGVCDLGLAVFRGFEHMTGLGVGLWVVGSVA